MTDRLVFDDKLQPGKTYFDTMTYSTYTPHIFISGLHETYRAIQSDIHRNDWTQLNVVFMDPGSGPTGLESSKYISRLQDYIYFFKDQFNISKYTGLAFLTEAEGEVIFLKSNNGSNYINNVIKYIDEVVTPLNKQTHNRLVGTDIELFRSKKIELAKGLDNVNKYYGNNFLPIYFTIQRLWLKQNYYKTYVEKSNEM